MATVKLAPVIRQRFFLSNGQPLSGGLLYTYLANTATPYASYVDASGATPNSNPVVLDSDGYCDLWLGSGAYKFVLTDADGNPIFTRDNITVIEDGSSSGASPWISHTITDGQSATDLVGQAFDKTKFSSVMFDCEIRRGLTLVANGRFAVQVVNGTPRVKTGFFLTDLPHGIGFSVSVTGNQVQLRAQASTGPGAGTLKLAKSFTPV